MCLFHSYFCVTQCGGAGELGMYIANGIVRNYELDFSVRKKSHQRSKIYLTKPTY